MRLLKIAQSNQKFPIIFKHRKRVAGTEKIRIVDTGSAAVLTTGVPTMNSHVWTISGPAGQRQSNPEQCYLQGVTTLTCGNYFIEAAGGLTEPVKIVNIVTSTRLIRFDRFLSNPYLSGTKLYCTDAYFALSTSSVVDSARNIYIQVDYLTNDGQNISWAEKGIVADNPIGCPLSIEDIYDIWPQLLDIQKASNAGSTWTRLLAQAWETVLARLATSGKNSNMFKSPDSLREVVKYEFAQLLALQGVDPRGANNPDTFLAIIQDLLISKWSALESSREFVDVQSSNQETIFNTFNGKRLRF